MPSSKTQAKDTPPPLPVALSYLEESRHFATGFLLVVPLLLAYQIGLMALRSDVVNWADGTIRLVFRLFGPAEPLLFAATVATLVAVSLWHAEQLRIDLELFGLMLAESVAYALALGLVWCVPPGVVPPPVPGSTPPPGVGYHLPVPGSYS